MSLNPYTNLLTLFLDLSDHLFLEQELSKIYRSDRNVSDITKIYYICSIFASMCQVGW